MLAAIIFTPAYRGFTASTIASVLLLAGCSGTPAANSGSRDPSRKQVTEVAVAPGEHAESTDRFRAGYESTTCDESCDTPPRPVKATMPTLPNGVPVSAKGSMVRVAFFVEADGSVTGARVIGTPRAELAALCIEAVQTWRFEPAMKSGAPVRVEVLQRFVFTRTPSLF